MLRRAAALASAERAMTTALIECMAVVDERRLWAGLGYASMFEFSAYGLRLGEAPAYKRIRAARAIRIFPPILPLLRERRLSLEGVAMLHPYLSGEDAGVVVAKACGLRIKALEALLAGKQTAAPQKDVVRYVGCRADANPPAPPEAPSEGALPLSSPSAAPSAPRSERVDTPPGAAQPAASPPSKLVRVAFTADEAFLRLLEKARAALRHKYPDGRLEGVLRDALSLLVERRDPVLRWRTARAARRRQNMS